MLKKIKCSLYRGGTSKAAFFVREDLPEKAEDRDILFQKVMGGNDPKQIDGLGGAQIVTSKVAIVGRSSMPGCDLDYTFVQVYPNKCGVDYSANCGNISSAVAMFAIERGLAEPEDGVTCLRIFNTNTNKVIVETLQTPQRRVSCEGNYSIVGVPGTGAPIVLKFENPAGAITGELTPTGKPTDRIQLPSGKQIRCSVIDCTSLFVFVPMKEFGLNGAESISELESRKDLLDDLEYIRGSIACKLNMAPDAVSARTASAALPKIALVGSPVDYITSGNERVEANQMNMRVCMMTLGKPHKSFAVTGAMCLTAATAVRDSVVAEIYHTEDTEYVVSIANPAGVMEAGVELDGGKIAYVSSYRTARLLMSGEAYYTI